MTISQKEILRRTVAALEGSLQRYPDNDKILHQLALGYGQIGRFDPAAIDVYRRTAMKFPADAKVQRALSIGYLISQSYQLTDQKNSIEEIDREGLDRSLERLLKLTREFPDSPYIHRALGDVQLLRGEDRDAVQHYRIAISLGLEELKPICAHFEEVRRLRPVSALVVGFFADLYQRVGMPETADALFREQIDVDHPDKLIVDKYADFLQRRLEDFSENNEEQLLRCHLQLTRIALKRGNVNEAVKLARQISPELFVRDVALTQEFASKLIAIEDYRLAYDYLVLLPLDEKTKGILNDMATRLEKRGELDTAGNILSYINNYDDYAFAGKAPKTEKKPPENLELNLDIETELQLAEIAWKGKRFEEAFERYIKVLDLGYKDYLDLLEPIDLLLSRLSYVSFHHLLFLTNFFADKRDWKRSLNYALRAQTEDPTHPQLSQRILQCCDRILVESPDDANTRLTHGDEHLRLGNIEKALQEYRRCSQSPEYKMKATRRLALANYKGGDHLGSLNHLLSLPLLETEDLERLYDLMLAFERNDQPKEAFDCARLIHEYDPKFRDVALRRADLEERAKSNQVDFLVDPKMRELIGDHSIGRYKYIGKIGSGGMGVVHRVLDIKSNTEVAMKILREGLSNSGKAIDRFFREARIAATLRHRNIVNIIDYNISNNHGQSYIAMEFVDGPSLRDLIEKKFASTVDISNEDVLEALDWVSQLCDALDATHKKGIIHRDIKPDNIMIGPGDTVKVTDFGIVHIEEATFTPTGALIGTPRYMSPEQVHGGRIDARSDIYAVGIILYEVLIGSPPFISGDISYQQVNVPPTPPREICPAIPAPLDKIIMKCLEKSPSARYQSAQELKKEIDELYIRLGGDPNRRIPGAMNVAPTTPGGTRRGASTPTREVKRSAPVLVPASAREGDSLDLSSDFDDMESETDTPNIAVDDKKKQNVTKDLETDMDLDFLGDEPG